MNKIDEKTWEYLSRDPTYPCAKCNAVENPQNCTNKKCLSWRMWVMRDWLTIQYNAGIMTKAEFEKRMEKVNERC